MSRLILAVCLLLSFGLNAQTDAPSEGAGLTIPPGDPMHRPIHTRSKTSIDASEALYIIDGYPANKQDLKELDPSSIKSINVLKGENAFALYGSKGKKNGVIIIQTDGEVLPRPDYTLTPEEIPTNLFSLHETLGFGEGKKVVYLLQSSPIKLRKLKKIATVDIASIKVYQRALKVKLMGYNEQEVVVDVTLR